MGQYLGLLCSLYRETWFVSCFLVVVIAMKAGVMYAQIIACSARCCLMGSILVSSCRFSVFVSRVHLVVIRSAVVCTVCSLFVFVSDIIGDQIVCVSAF